MGVHQGCQTLGLQAPLYDSRSLDGLQHQVGKQPEVDCGHHHSCQAHTTSTLHYSLPDPAAQSGDCLLHTADQPRDVHTHELAPALPEHAVHPHGVDVPWL